MQNKQGYFYLIPSLLAENGEPTKALLFGLVASLSNKEGFCWASNKYLASKLKLRSVTQIKIYLRELSKEGWLRVEILNNSKRKLSPLLTNLGSILSRGGRNTDQGRSDNWPPLYISNKTSNKTSRGANAPQESKELLKGGEKSNGQVGELWQYFLLKTKRGFKLTLLNRNLITERLSSYKLEELKVCVDNFVNDEWPGRKDHLDLIYCIGHQKGKPDAVEKWLNKPGNKVVRYL